MTEALPKVSVITSTWNAREFIADAIRSVQGQTYARMEHVIKDAGSTDGTLEAVHALAYDGLKLVVAKDSGIYAAWNQALAEATGDICVFLGADDVFASSDAVAKMVRRMEEANADIGWGDLVYVDRADQEKVFRRWTSAPYRPGVFRRGWHPPFPAMFIRRRVFERVGGFREDLRIAGDYEFALRALEKHRVSSVYLPETIVKMRAGGTSGTLRGWLWRNRLEDGRAWQLNGLRGGFLAAFFLKPISKVAQLFRWPGRSG